MLRELSAVRLLAVVFLGIFAGSACRSAAPAAREGSELPAASPADAGFHWPVPERWRAETIPFPLDFAPGIPLRGVEELRFPPGMFDPKAPLYFSYAFVFWLEGRPELNPANLEEILRDYFVGLTRTVADSRQLTLDTAPIRATLRPVATAKDVHGHPAQEVEGTVWTFDPFNTGAPLELGVRSSVWSCPVAGRLVALFLASPRPPRSPAWLELDQRHASFRCH